jgi:ribose transport system ATP-binding protein
MNKLDATVPLLKAENLIMRFPGVVALKDVSFQLQRGEVHVLVGENGAGKSTLIKILSGALPPDDGAIFIDGKLANLRDPRHAQNLGIFTIYQELPLVPQLSVAENIFLGRERRNSALPVLTAKSEQLAHARRALETLEYPLDPNVPVQDLLVGEQQMVAIAKALVNEVRILILDEPTSALTDREVKVLFQLLRNLKERGVAVVYISHRLEEAKEIGDRITVLRDGQSISTVPAQGVDLSEIIRLMVGREIEDKFPKVDVSIGKPLVEVTNLRRGKSFRNVSFVVREGEIVCLTGLVGSGTAELGQALFGVVPAESGTIQFEGKPVKLSSPREAIQLGFGYIPGDRKREGVIQLFTIRQNISLPVLRRLSRFLILRKSEERSLSEQFKERLDIRAPSVDTLVQNLSGGNQQKVVLAKMLSTQAKFFIFDHPTAGIDVGAKVEIYQFMAGLVQAGAAVLLISSELPECLAIGDRILVFHRGEIAGELSRDDATQDRILTLAFGRSLRHIQKEAT